MYMPGRACERQSLFRRRTQALYCCIVTPNMHAHLLLLLLQRLGVLHLRQHLLRARPLVRRAVGRQVLQVRDLLPPLRSGAILS